MRVSILEDQQGWAFDPRATFDSIAEVTGVFASVGEFAAAAHKDPAVVGDVVICDLHLGAPPSGAHAIKAVRNLPLDRVPPGVVAVSWITTTASISDAFAAGALSFVAKNARTPDHALWQRVIESAATDRPYLTAALATHLARDRFDRPLPCGELSGKALRLLAEVQDGCDLAVPPFGHEPAILARLLEEIQDKAALRTRAYSIQLTPKQLEVAKLAYLGRTRKQMCRDLSITDATCGDHFKAIRSRLPPLARHFDTPGGLAAVREAWERWCAQECLSVDYIPETLTERFCPACRHFLSGLASCACHH